MEALLIYMLKNTVCAGILLLYYSLALRNKKFHYYNRFYLLSIVVASLLLPFLNLQWFTVHSSNEQVIQLFNIIYTDGGEKEHAAAATFPFSWSEALLAATLLTCSLLLVIQLVKIMSILRLKKLYPKENLEHIDLINTDLPQAPFSFLNNLFWRSDILLSEETGQQIFRHELTHIKQKHTWDKLFMQLVLCFCWMNPFYWIIRRELYLIHEFIADEKAVGDKDAGAFAAMLLQSQFGRFAFSPAHPFAYSPIKRRLTMLTNSTNARYSYVRRLMILPLLIFVTGLFAFRIAQQNQENGIGQTITKQPFRLIVDAGHGGNDAGAYGLNNVQEKDFTLLIARKVKSLAAEYGIEAILTRDADHTVELKNRTQFANSQQANALISLHMNSTDAATGNNKAGMEVYVSSQNAQLNQSRVMGSALITSIGSSFNIRKALVQNRQAVWILKSSAMPAVIIECGFMTNASDLALINDDSKLETLARKILAGVAAYANQFEHTPGTATAGQPAPETYTTTEDSHQTTTAVTKAATKTNKAQATTAFAASPEKITLNADAIMIRQAAGTTGTDSAYQNPQHGSPMYIVDGKVVDASAIKLLSPSSIQTVSVYKDSPAAIAKYGPEARDGVVEIFTRSAAAPAVKPASKYNQDLGNKLE